jgi:hypothetical protein
VETVVGCPVVWHSPPLVLLSRSALAPQLGRGVGSFGSLAAAGCNARYELVPICSCLYYGFLYYGLRASPAV